MAHPRRNPEVHHHHHNYRQAEQPNENKFWMLITQGHVLEARYNYLGWVKIKKSVTAADEESPEVRSSVIFYKKTWVEYDRTWVR